VRFHDFTHDEEAKAGATRVHFAAVGGARVALKQLRQDLRRYARAVVGDAHLAPAGDRARPNDDASSRRAELDGVGDQVGEHLLQTPAIAEAR
jgi:hypothetical protein